MSSTTGLQAEGAQQLFFDRSQAYAFFSNVFLSEVSEEFLASFASCCPEGSESLERFACMLETADHASVLSDLKADFAALFLNMSAHPVFTSESVYLSETHIMMQEQRDAVLEEYARCGFAVSDSFREPEDHIAVELHFMSLLCGRAGALIESEDEASIDFDVALKENTAVQRRFVLEHLAKWVPEFCDAAIAGAHTLFYKGVAEMLKGFLAEEVRFVRRG